MRDISIRSRNIPLSCHAVHTFSDAISSLISQRVLKRVSLEVSISLFGLCLLRATCFGLHHVCGPGLLSLPPPRPSTRGAVCGVRGQSGTWGIPGLPARKPPRPLRSPGPGAAGPRRCARCRGGHWPRTGSFSGITAPPPLAEAGGLCGTPQRSVRAPVLTLLRTPPPQELKEAYQDAASNLLLAVCRHSWRQVARHLETEVLTGVFPHRSLLHVMGVLTSQRTSCSRVWDTPGRPLLPGQRGRAIGRALGGEAECSPAHRAPHSPPALLGPLRKRSHLKSGSRWDEGSAGADSKC